MDTQQSRPTSRGPASHATRSQSQWPSRLWLAPLLIVALLVAGCSGSDAGAASPAGTQTATPKDATQVVAATPTGGPGSPQGRSSTTLSPLDRPPPLIASGGGPAVPLGLGTNCWTPPGAGAGLCADTFGIVTSNVALRVERGEAVAVSGALRHGGALSVVARIQPVVEDPVFEWGEDRLEWSPSSLEPLAVTFDGDSIRFDVDVDLEPGRYIVAVFVDFTHGDAQYGFLLDIAGASVGGTDGPQGAGPGGDSSTPPPPLDRPPPLVAAADGNSRALGLYSSCWSAAEGPALCVDAIGIVTVNAALLLARGERLTITGTVGLAGAESVLAAVRPVVGDPIEELRNGLLAWRLPPGTPLAVDLDADSIRFDVDLEPGRYVLTFFMRFPQGDASYGLLLEVE